MVLGIITGAVINSKYTSYYKSLSEKAVSELTTKNETITKQIQTTIKQTEKKAKKDNASAFSILSDIFLRLIKMIIAPLVFTVLVVGVAKVGDFKSVGRIGLKTMLYFTGATLIALMLGLVIVNLFEPGKKMQLEKPSSQQEQVVQAHAQNAKNFISHVIPDSIVKAMAENEVLPIVVFALFFGVGAASLGARGEIVVKLCDSVSHIMFKITNYVMLFAPLGIFGAITAVVIQQGLDVLGSYVYLIANFYGGLFFFVFGVLFIVSVLAGIKYFKLLAHIKEPILLAFSTASSEAAMPKTIEALEKFGISNRVVSFVLPLGYSFNLDGSIMYMTFATMFIAQIYGIEISTMDQINMMLILLVTSKGMAGVPRASLVVIAGMLEMFHIPGEGLLLLLAVDQLLDMGRSATNVVGNAVASGIVARWEGEKLA